MHVDSSIGLSGLLNETDRIIKDALYLLSNVIFQVILLVLERVPVIVGTIVSSTIDDMGDTKAAKDLVVLGDKVAAEVQEIVNDFRADSLIVFILVFFS